MLERYDSRRQSATVGFKEGGRDCDQGMWTDPRKSKRQRNRLSPPGFQEAVYSHTNILSFSLTKPLRSIKTYDNEWVFSQNTKFVWICHASHRKEMQSILDVFSAGWFTFLLYTHFPLFSMIAYFLAAVLKYHLILQLNQTHYHQQLR